MSMACTRGADAKRLQRSSSRLSLPSYRLIQVAADAKLLLALSSEFDLPKTRARAGKESETYGHALR